MLEALNFVQDKLNIPHASNAVTPEHQQSFEQRITTKLDSILNMLSMLQRDIALVHNSNQKILQQSESMLNALHVKVDSATTMLKGAHENGSYVGRALLFFAS